MSELQEAAGAALTDFVYANGSDFDADEWPGMAWLRSVLDAGIPVPDDTGPMQPAGALAAPSRDAGLDVERLARAIWAVEDAKHVSHEWTWERFDEEARALFVREAKTLAAAYAADGAPVPAGVNRADPEGER